MIFPDFFPPDVFGEAEMFVLQDGDRSGVQPLERSQLERPETRLHYVQRGEVVVERPPADDFQVPEVGQIGEVVVVGLDVEISGDLFQGVEDFQSVWVHGGVPLAERVVRVDVLEALERILEDDDVALYHGAALEAVDVARMDVGVDGASLRTGPLAGHARPVFGLLVGRTRADAGPVVLEQMFGTVLDARGPVRVLPLRIVLPRVGRRVVDLHRRALLRADPAVVKVPTSYTVTLLGARAAPRTEQVAALARVRSETPALVALRAAVLLGELLTVLLALPPTALLAALVAQGAVPFGGGEIVHEHVTTHRIGDDLLPVDGLDVAEVVVVEEADAALEDVPQRRQLEREHLGEGHQQGELFLAHVHLEEGPAADDLQPGQDDPLDVHVRDQDVTGHLADVLEEAQVEVLVLQPRQLQVTVDVGAVGVAVLQVPVVVVAVRRNGHATVGSDAN